MLRLSDPEIVEHKPYHVVGIYATFDGNDEGPGWNAASREFYRRKSEVTNRTDDRVLGFLYRPHRDHPEIPEDIRACFVGVDVHDFDHVPEGLSTTHFSGGQYVGMTCHGDTEGEAAMGVGQAVERLGKWTAENGFREGDVCFAWSSESASKPPFVEHVYMKVEPASHPVAPAS